MLQNKQASKFGTGDRFQQQQQLKKPAYSQFYPFYSGYNGYYPGFNYYGYQPSQASYYYPSYYTPARMPSYGNRFGFTQSPYPAYNYYQFARPSAAPSAFGAYSTPYGSPYGFYGYGQQPYYYGQQQQQQQKQQQYGYYFYPGQKFDSAQATPDVVYGYGFIPLTGAVQANKNKATTLTRGCQSTTSKAKSSASAARQLNDFDIKEPVADNNVDVKPIQVYDVKPLEEVVVDGVVQDVQVNNQQEIVQQVDYVAIPSSANTDNAAESQFNDKVDFVEVGAAPVVVPDVEPVAARNNEGEKPEMIVVE